MSTAPLSATAFASHSAHRIGNSGGLSLSAGSSSGADNSRNTDDVRINSFKSEYKSVMASLRSISRSLSMSSIAKQGHEDFTQIVKEMRSLSKAMESNEVTDADRSNAQSSLSAKRNDLDSLIDNIAYRGEQLFDGNFSGQIQLGKSRDDMLSFSFSDYRSTAFPGPASLDDIDISSQSGATAGTAILDDALDELQGLGIEIGAFEYRLHSEADLLTRTSARSKSQLEELSDEMGEMNKTEEMAQRTAYLKQAASKLMLIYGNPSALLPMLLE